MIPVKVPNISCCIPLFKITITMNTVIDIMIVAVIYFILKIDEILKG